MSNNTVNTVASINTNVNSDLLNLRKLTKVLDMIADKAGNGTHTNDESIVIASMYPQVPHITFGMVRKAMREVDAIENAHKRAELLLKSNK